MRIRMATLKDVPLIVKINRESKDPVDAILNITDN